MLRIWKTVSCFHLSTFHSAKEALNAHRSLHGKETLSGTWKYKPNSRTQVLGRNGCGQLSRPAGKTGFGVEAGRDGASVSPSESEDRMHWGVWASVGEGCSGGAGLADLCGEHFPGRQGQALLVLVSCWSGGGCVLASGRGSGPC